MLRVHIWVATGVTANNLTFYPMIRPASIADGTYEEYREVLTNEELSDAVAAINELREELTEVSGMINDNRYYARITDDDGAIITDDDGTEICGDWTFQIL